MSIYLTGDTHIPIDIRKLNTKNFPEQKTLTDKDYLIVLGDFGLLWHEDREYRYWKNWLDTRNFTTLWIDGNHENHDWIDSLPVTEWNGGKVHKVTDKIIHLMRGQIFTIDKMKFFTFGGANSIDKFMRIRGKTWWEREVASSSEMDEGFRNLDKRHWCVDYILTHTCPKWIIPSMFPKTHTDVDPTENYLDYISKQAYYKHWFFGHWHETKTWCNFTCLYNEVIRLE